MAVLIIFEVPVFFCFFFPFFPLARKTFLRLVASFLFLAVCVVDYCTSQKSSCQVGEYDRSLVGYIFHFKRMNTNSFTTAIIAAAAVAITMYFCVSGWCRVFCFYS